MTRRRLAPLLLAAALLTGCTSAENSSPSEPEVALADVETTMRACPEQPDTPAAGAQRMPEVVLECIGGGSVDFARAPGTPTMLTFWGSWCPPCRRELPLAEQLAEAGGEQLRVLGVVIQDGIPQATSFAQDAGVTFPGAYDLESRVLAELGQRSPPVTILLDAEGGITFTKVGEVTSLEEFRQLVAEHLGVTL